jgi:hypothetical protein
LVLYELLTLRPPIEATNRENLLRTIVTKPLVPVDWRNTAVPEGLRRIVHKATQKDPDQRYASAAALARDLEKFLAGQSVDAPAYLFRLDEREITAQRPGQVVMAAMIYFMISFFLSLGLASVTLMMGIIISGTPGNNLVALITSGIQGALALGVLAAGVAIGMGLLSARAWARWTGVVFGGLLFLGSFCGIIGLGMLGYAMLYSSDFQNAWDSIEKTTAEQQQNQPGPADANPRLQVKHFMFGTLALYGVPLLAGFAMSIAVLWALLCRATADWFRFARELRREHHQARMMLSA